MKNIYLLKDKKDLVQDIVVYAEAVENNIINKTDHYYFRKASCMAGLGFRYLVNKNYAAAELALRKLYASLSQLHNKLQVEIDPAEEWIDKIFQQTLPDIETFFGFLKKGAGSSSSKSSEKGEEILYQTHFMPIEAIRMCLTICGEFYNPAEPLHLAGLDKASPLYSELKAFLTFCHFEFCNKDFHERMKRDPSVLNILYKACDDVIRIRQHFNNQNASNPSAFLNQKKILNKDATPFFPKANDAQESLLLSSKKVLRV